MKLELPFAFGLLALGCLLCWNNPLQDFLGSNGNESAIPEELVLDPASDGIRSLRLQSDVNPLSVPKIDVASMDVDSQVTQAGGFDFLEHGASPNELGMANPDMLVIEQTGFDEPVDDQAAGKSLFPRDMDSTHLVRRSAKNLAASPPISARARIQVSMFDDAFIAQGQYLQQGRGSNKARFEFVTGEGENAIQIVQICDGRYAYLVKTIAGVSELEFLDLGEIAAKMTPEVSFVGKPATWFSTGGLASLLQRLGTSFEFKTAKPIDVDGIQMVSVIGQWRPGRLQQLLQGQIDYQDVAGQIEWDRMPPQIPHQVEIVMGNDAFLPLFPYRIIFSKFDGESGKAQPAMSLEMFEVAKMASIDPSFFQVRTSQTTPFNVTRRHLTQIEAFQEFARIQLEQRQADSGVPAMPTTTQR